MSDPAGASIHSFAQSTSTPPEKVELNAYGVPISSNAGKIGSRLGKLVRIHVPISYESWDKVPKKFKDDVWNELLTYFDLEPHTKDYFLKKMPESFRRHKSEMRTTHYDKFDNDEDRVKNRPQTINEEDWKGFLINEAKLGARERRDKGKKNRAQYSYGHHTGRKSHAIIEHEMVVENPTKEITRREVWEKAHTKKDGTISDTATSYFEKITKAKETINDSDEEELPLDKDILTQVFGKDKRGRTRSVGTKISRTQVKASTTARKQVKKVQGSQEEVNVRLNNMEGKLDKLFDLVEGYMGQGNQAPIIHSNVVGSSGTRKEIHSNDIVAQPNLSCTAVKCEILNADLEVVATAVVCRDSTASIIHGKPVPATHEKLVVDSIRLPAERTTKPNHPLAETFGEVGTGGFVCHPKNLIRYL